MRKLSGSSRPKHTKPGLPKNPASPSKAQLAARERYVRKAERELGIRITQADIDAIHAEIASLG